MWRESRMNGDVSGDRYFLTQRRQGKELAAPAELLSLGVDFALGDRLLRPAAGIKRCGTAAYAWRDGYAAEIWSLSRSLSPIWSKLLVGESGALRVTSAQCEADDGLTVFGLTEDLGEDGLPTGVIRQLSIKVAPFESGVPGRRDLGVWLGPPPVEELCQAPTLQ